MRKINICCAIFLCLFAFNMFSHVAFASESPVIRVAIVDNLMSQKLASEQYVRDYMDGIKTAQKAAATLGYKLEYKTFFYSTEHLSILKEIDEIKHYRPDFIIGPRSSDNFLLLAPYFSDVLVLSPLASSPKIATMPDNFYSMTFSDDFSSSIMATFIAQTFKKQHLFAISEMDCNSCLATTRQVMAIYHHIYPASTITEKQVISDDVETLDIKTLMQGYHHHDDVILLPGTSYASGVLISRIVNTLQKPAIFVGGDGWGSWSVSYVGKLKTTFPYQAYRVVPQYVDIASHRNQQFQDYYQAVFHRKTPADSIIYIAYAAVMSVMYTLPHDINTSVTPSFILQQYREKRAQDPWWFKPQHYAVYLIQNNQETFFKTLPVNYHENNTHHGRDL